MPCIPRLWITEFQSSPFFRFNITTISDAVLNGIKTVAGGSGSDRGLDGASLGGCGTVVTVAVKHAGTPAVAANNIVILPAPNESDGNDDKLTLLVLRFCRGQNSVAWLRQL